MTIFDLALLILRLAVGLTWAAHGAQKAFGWWEGPGPAKWLKAVHTMGFHPPALFAAISIMIELVGGVALALGFVTPLAAAVLVAQAVVISVKVHLPHGFFSTRGGLEFPFVLGAASMAIGLLLPGALSLDGVLGLAFEPGMRAFLALVGIVGGFAALAAPRLITIPARRPLGRSQ
jgi:putative oxidoreductase